MKNESGEKVNVSEIGQKPEVLNDNLVYALFDNKLSF